MRRLFLMRHGETLYLGRESPDGTDLTPEGRRQVEAAAELLGGVPLDLVFSSPMLRAMGTAGIVAGKQGAVVQEAAELREITPGLLDGMGLAEVFSQVLRFFSDPTVTWDTPFVGGETFRALRARVLDFLRRLLALPQWANALAVAHGGANMALLSCVLGLREGEIPRLEQDLACINVIDFDEGGRGLVRLINLSAHDLLKDTLREPSSARLRRVFEARMGEGARVRWRAPDGEPEI